MDRSDTDAGPRAPLWLRLALAVSSWRWRPRSGLCAQDAGAVRRAEAAGWTIRSAAPRWEAVWRAEPEALSRCRVILIPDTGIAMTPPECRALLRARLAEVGIVAPAPDPRHLRMAEHKRITALAPGWLDASPDRDIACWWTR